MGLGARMGSLAAALAIGQTASAQLPDTIPFRPSGVDYDQVVPPSYDAFYRMNVETDIASPDSTAKLDDYDLIVVPALYAASDAEIGRLNDFARRRAHLLHTFKSGSSARIRKSAARPGRERYSGELRS